MLPSPDTIFYGFFAASAGFFGAKYLLAWISGLLLSIMSLIVRPKQ